MESSRPLDRLIMNSDSRLRVSLQITHPIISADEIIGHFNYPILYKNSVGMPQQNKNGLSLGEISLETAIRFELHDKEITSCEDMHSYEDISEILLDDLEGFNKEFLQKIVATGGRCAFLIEASKNENVFLELSDKLIHALSSLGAAVYFDFYGGVLHGNSDPSFRVSLRTEHPSLSADEIDKHFSYPAHRKCSVGMPRKSKAGLDMKGVWPVTYVGFRMHDKAITNFEGMSEFLLDALDGFDKAFMNEFIATGGRCRFLFGIFADDHAFWKFSPELMNSLSSLNFAIDLDCYGSYTED